MEDTEQATYRLETGQGAQATLTLKGRLDHDGTASLWRPCMRELRALRPKQLTVQVGQVEYCDGAGIALLMEIQRIQADSGGRAEIRDLRPQFRQLMALFEIDHQVLPPKPLGPLANAIHNIGRWAAGLFFDFTAQVSFIGEICVKLLKTLFHPASLRRSDTFLMAEKAGVNAVGITALLGFLIGLILAFQSAAAMQKFGAEIFVADLVAIALFRELGPLITALVLASRSGSAFAAELGTMKVNEEVDALVTMGLDPVQFLVLPRLIAAVCMLPLLTMFNLLFGLIGCGVVMTTWDVPISTYIERVSEAATLGDVVGGLAKTFVFGTLIAGIGCLRGLQTGTGPSAVGDSATRAVVSGIIAIVVADGIFAVVYYFLGI
ncbi:MAG: MlaE family lipid ABC transporter permease subunit [Planctomycetes bacterium]|nr:MlaE family lipid ABC transporter permease subunit [Planctomycetota bacterium]